MYCPRCGTQAIETPKFCRSCGLALSPVTTYVATGGTAPLTPPPLTSAPTSGVRSFWDQLPPRQQMKASILAFIFAIPFLGVFGGGRMAGMAATLMPLGIIWSVWYFKAKQRELEQRQLHHSPTPQMYTPPQPTPVAYQAPPPPPRTNPLADAPPPRPHVPSSVTEEETQRLPQLPRQME